MSFSVTKPKILAFMAIRGSSKSIPRKNIKILAGKPMCYWTCKAAHQSKHIEKLYVSTEDAEIKKTVESFGFNLEIIDRPEELAGDLTLLEEIIFHGLKYIPDFDILITIQATSPLTKAENIDEAIDKFLQHNYDSMLTGVEIKRFIWTKDGKPLNYNPLKRPMRQQFEGSIMENGAFYITKKEILQTVRNRLGGNIGIYQMPHYMATEIDEPEDWVMIEKIIKEHNEIF
jgi:CMP-N-acetylneuraminic acid synthetase